MILLCFSLPVQAEEIIWRAFNDSGVKFFDSHEYEKAEKSLLDAVKEAEKIGPQSIELKTSLNELHRVCVAMGKNSEAEAIAKRLSLMDGGVAADKSTDTKSEETAGTKSEETTGTKSEETAGTRDGDRGGERATSQQIEKFQEQEKE